MAKIEHVLIPKHEIISDKEKEKLFEKYNITIKELPVIKLTDPAIGDLDVKVGDVIKITRTSSTAGTTVFFRGVVNG